jgi:hypothetical protein
MQEVKKSNNEDTQFSPMTEQISHSHTYNARPTFSLLHIHSSDIAPSFSVLAKPLLPQKFWEAFGFRGKWGLLNKALKAN